MSHIWTLPFKPNQLITSADWQQQHAIYLKQRSPLNAHFPVALNDFCTLQLILDYSTHRWACLKDKASKYIWVFHWKCGISYMTCLTLWPTLAEMGHFHSDWSLELIVNWLEICEMSRPNRSAAPPPPPAVFSEAVRGTCERCFCGYLTWLSPSILPAGIWCSVQRRVPAVTRSISFRVHIQGVTCVWRNISGGLELKSRVVQLFYPEWQKYQQLLAEKSLFRLILPRHSFCALSVDPCSCSVAEKSKVVRCQINIRVFEPSMDN